MLRAEGTDAGSMDRGKLVGFEREGDSGWEPVGTIIASGRPDAGSTWIDARTISSFALTLEGYLGTAPLYVEVPPVAPGDYRFRVDLQMAGAPGSIQDRTATLYGPIRVFA